MKQTKQTKSMLVLRLLNSVGPLTKAQIVEKLGNKTIIATIRNLSGQNGFIRQTSNAYEPAYDLTDKGRSHLSQNKPSTAPPKAVEIDLNNILTLLATADDAMTVVQLISGLGPPFRTVSIVQDRMTALIARGHAVRGLDLRYGYTITDAGESHLAKLRDLASRPVAPPRTIPYAGTYSGLELRPFTGRPGSMHAFSLPSRGIGA